MRPPNTDPEGKRLNMRASVARRLLPNAQVPDASDQIDAMLSRIVLLQLGFDRGPAVGGHLELQLLAGHRDDRRPGAAGVVEDRHDAAVGVPERQGVTAARPYDAGAAIDVARQVAEQV